MNWFIALNSKINNRNGFKDICLGLGSEIIKLRAGCFNNL